MFLSTHKSILAVAAIVLAVGGASLWLGEGPASGASGRPLSCAMPQQDRAAPHPGMVWVPGGSFDLGDSVYAEELPIRPVSIAGFWMDRTEVTNKQFAEFVLVTGYITTAERPVDPRLFASLPLEMREPGAVVFVPPKAVNRRGDVTQWWRFIPGASWRHPGGPQTTTAGRGSFPVVAVTFEDAKAFARWKGNDLPTEAQWEWAARAGQASAGQDHEQPKGANTWQGVFPVLNSADDGFTGLAPVGCYAPNALGLFDMIGNVWELTSDAYTPNHNEPIAGTPDQVPPDMRKTSSGQRVIKGGSFLCSPDYCMRYRSGARQPQDDDLGASHLGFRTILAAPGP
jgi:sulfatase modifying factor 1